MRQIYKCLNRLDIVIGVVLLLSFSYACTNETPDLTYTPGQICSLTITGTIQIPGMSELLTRGTMGEVPGSGLKLSILQFEASNKDANAAQWWLNEVYEAETLDATNVGNNGIVKFKVTLKSTDQPTRLHLMISDNFINTSQGSEATVLPNLYVTGNREAYWGVVQFNDGLTTTTNENDEVKVELRPEVVTKLQNVPVIRNFARIRVTNSSPSTFEYFGFGIVHMPNQGSIAPIDPNPENPSVPTLTSGNTMLDYNEIARSYSGYTPGTAVFQNTEQQARNWAYSDTQTNITLSPKYIYEHPYESTRRTYLIVYGRYIPTNEYGYYKIDIGKQAENGLFDYYNIIRNIDYNVVIQSVSAPGTTTAAEAITRSPFNNLMASTETATMLNVSDGNNMLIVNDTNHIFTKAHQTVDILYRYIKGVTNTKVPANSELPEPVGLTAGPDLVIKSFVKHADPFVDDAGVEWVWYTITCNNPTDIVKTQDFTIVDGNGLGRTIHLILRTPWQYVPIGEQTALIKNGTSNTYSSTTNDVISSAAQAHLTVFFNLPGGLPEAMFPLEFQLEAKNQGIENDKIGTLVVNSGQSLFDPSKIAISYIKTVSYNEYLYNYSDESNNMVDVNSPNTNHTVRCRFLTITATTDNDAEIMIYNPYFSPNASVKFTRR